MWYALTFVCFKDCDGAHRVFNLKVRAPTALEASNLAQSRIPPTMKPYAIELCCWCCGPTEPNLE